MDASKSLCTHASVVIHAVEGGYRAHCLRCGALSPVCKEREDALKAILNSTGEERASDYYEADRSLSAPLRRRVAQTVRRRAEEG